MCERERQRETERDIERHRETAIETQTEGDRERQRETARDSERQRETERDRETERQRLRLRERALHLDCVGRLLTAPNLIRTFIYDKMLGSKKITASLDHGSPCRPASGTN